MKKRLMVVLSIVLALVLVAGGYGIGSMKGITVNVKYEGVKDVGGSVDNSPKQPDTTNPPVVETTAPTTAPSEAPTAGNDPAPPAQDTTAAPPASSLPATKDEIVARYNEVINNAKASTGNVTIHKVEAVNVGVDDCSGGSLVRNTVDKIVQGFLTSTDETLTFNAGTATKSDGGTKALNDYIPPNGRQTTLEAAGVKEATCVDNGDGTYVINLTLNEEKVSYDGTTPVNPTYHYQAMDPLNLATLDVSPATIVSADMTYPGLTVKATISESGQLKELYHKAPLIGVGVGKVIGVSLDITLSGDITDTWTYTW